MNEGKYHAQLVYCPVTLVIFKIRKQFRLFQQLQYHFIGSAQRLGRFIKKDYKAKENNGRQKDRIKKRVRSRLGEQAVIYA